MGIIMRTISVFRAAAAAVVVAAATSFATSAFASPFFPFGPPNQAPVAQMPAYEATDESAELPARFKRQIVDYRTSEQPGTIVIDTPNTYLYLVLGNGKAMRYGIGVGREGFTWSGTQSISKKAEWPDWTPPAEMLERQPYLPRFMAGGPGNPLGARAMYLGASVYRIHGTNDPSTIGHRVSSGCIRLTNDDVADLYSRVNLGTKVVVLPMTEQRASAGSGGIY
jgi:lipoprotein-anchoring transpeptidase ErfK/SrfK